MNWDVISIGDADLKIADGNYSAKYPRSEEFVKQGIPFIRANNFYNKGIVDDELYFISPQKHSEITKGHLKAKDVLITTRGNIGTVALVPARHENSNINAQIVLLRCGASINQEYLLHVLSTDYVTRQLPSLTTGTALKQLPVKNLKKLQIPLPPLPVQQKIAAILDEADKLRQFNKQLIAKYDELTQSLFLDMFGDPVSNPKGWDEIKFGEFSNLKAGKFVSASEIVSEQDSGMYPCYGGGNGLRGYVESFTHEGEYVLIGRQGALCGNVKIAQGVFHATEHAIVCSPKMDYSTQWLYYLLYLSNLNRYATGAAQPGLNVGKLVELSFMFPLIGLQNQFSERVQVIEAQKAQAQQGLEKAEELFNSLLQRAFKGELV